jgi:biopolymer transport protein ExbD
MLRQRKKKVASCKPNVIPILDAVFIFIFFLLMSAQFLEIHEIGSDAPAVKTISEDNKNDRPPLNLILKITKNKITVMTGLDQNIVKTIKRNSDKTIPILQEELLKLKQKHPKEISVILKPSKSVEFKSIVQIMDGVREYIKPAELIAGTATKKHFASKELFTQVIFETIN